MNARSRIPLISLSLLILAALACNAGGQTPSTTTAQTVEALLTASALPGTPLAGAPSATPPPTASFVPSATFTAPAEKPSDTPGPTNTPGPQGCADDALFVADVTVPDNTVFNPGTPFTKTWRLRNTGTCAWGGSYSLTFFAGAAMNGPASVPITGSVPPGSDYDVSVNLVAPGTPGVYKGTWRMINTAYAPFGSQPFVQIVVAAASVTPTQTASPGPSHTPTQTPTATLTGQTSLNWPLVKTGDTGANVYAVQYLLRQSGATLTADGIFGAQTEAAVKSFQSANGLNPDGIVGPLTWPKLIVTVQQGSNGEAVRAVQRLLNDKYGFSLAVDGAFGPQTAAAVKAFQGSRGLAMDGIVGPNTWSALVS